jgi:hypothetical protein
MVLNFGPPLIDMSPLGKLGETYDRSRARARQADIETARTQALSTFGQNSDLAALGQTLLRAGDLEGGMQALRLHAANSGTPWQREQAAREQERYEAGRTDLRTQREKEEERYQETQRRLNQPKYEREVDTDTEGNPIPGLVYPDGRVKPLRPGGTGLGPLSGGAGDPNLPEPTSQAAAGQLAAEPNPNDYGVPTPNPARERGYVIPGTLEGFPHGTVRMPGGAVGGPVVAPPAGRAAIAAPPIPTVTRGADLPAPGAQPQQAQLAPPSGQVAVAAPAQGQAPIQRRLNREDPLEPPTVPFVRAPPPHVNIKGWIAGEVERVKKVTGPEGGGEKLTKEQADARAAAGKMIGAEKEYGPNEAAATTLSERFWAGALPNLKNYVTSEKFQAGMAARREWIAGLLRKESGAAVTDTEFETYNDIYFPEPGQGGNIAAQKARARERALQGVKAGLTPAQIAELEKTAGTAPKAPGEAGNLSPAAPAGPAAPAVPENAKTAPNGIRFW